jgi:hypothetical protein
MKTEKMSFKNIKDVLSRDEMKSIMAGSGCDILCYCDSYLVGRVCSTQDCQWLCKLNGF